MARLTDREAQGIGDILRRLRREYAECKREERQYDAHESPLSSMSLHLHDVAEGKKYAFLQACEIAGVIGFDTSAWKGGVE